MNITVTYRCPRAILGDCDFTPLPWPIGRRHTKETIKKIRQSNLGRLHSPETIEKMRLSNLGQRRSPETIENIRLSKIGRKHSEESKRKMSLARKGKRFSETHKRNIGLAGIGKHKSKGLINVAEENGMWKGDDVRINGLHEYMRNHLPKSDLCQFCKQCPPYDIACVTLVYNRDSKNWRWLCRSCHVEYDIMIGVRKVLRGEESPWFERHHTQKTKLKIRLALLGRKYSPEAILKMRSAKLGKKHSPETKRKIRKSMLAYFRRKGD